MATVGLDNVYYALITKDDESGTTYEAPKKLGPAINLTKAPTVNRSNLHADNGVIATASSKGAITVSVGVSELSKQVKADLFGMTINTDGVLISSKDDRPQDVALMGRAEKSNGEHKYIVLYKVQFNPPEETIDTKAETPTFNTPSMTGEAIPRLSDGRDEASVDSDDADIIDPTIIQNWFTSVYEESPGV